MAGLEGHALADDIIKHFVSRMAAFAPPEEVRRVELELRQHWGGCEVYVAKDPTRPKAERLGAGIAAGLSLRAAFEAAGVSRATGYRLLKLRTRR